MKILVIYPYIPYPLDRGVFQRTFHLLRGLAREHTVDLMALSENGDSLEHKPVFEAFCREVEFIPFEHPEWSRMRPGRLLRSMPATVSHWTLPQLAEAIRARLSRHSYDLVHVCDIVLAQYFMDEHKDIPLSVDRSRVDLQFQLQQTAFNPASWKGKVSAWENMAKLWRYEKRVARRCQLQVLCGPDDEIFVRRHISRQVPLKVVANGVDLDFFQPEATPAPLADKPVILFAGPWTTPPTSMPCDGIFRKSTKASAPRCLIWKSGLSENLPCRK